MSTPLPVGGVTIQFPTQGQNPNWGTQLTQWATLVTANLVPKAGGTFNLTGEVSFGAVAGIKLLYVKSITTNAPSVGFVRMANSDFITWRNAANTDTVALAYDSDQLNLSGQLIAYTNIRQTFTRPQAGSVFNLPITTGTATLQTGLFNNFYLNISEAVTIALDNTNVQNGQTMILSMKQSGSFTVTWPGNFNFLTSSTVTTTNGKRAMLTGQYSTEQGNIWLVSLINEP